MRLFRRLSILLFTALFVFSTNGVTVYSVYCLCRQKAEVSLVAKNNCCQPLPARGCHRSYKKTCCAHSISYLKISSQYQLTAAFAKKNTKNTGGLPFLPLPNLVHLSVFGVSAAHYAPLRAPHTCAPPACARLHGRRLRIAVQSFLC